MQIGLVGLPGSGKTTLFNLLTGSDHPVGLSGADEIFFGSAARVREAGHFRLAGKEYLIRDGDIINFRFNV